MGKKGKLIVIEGPDGSGKQTQVELLMKKFKEFNRNDFLKVSFPNYGHASSAMVEKYLDPKGGIGNVYPGEDNLIFVKQASLFYTVDRVGTMIEKDKIIVGDNVIKDNSLKDICYADEKHIGPFSYIELLERGFNIICDRYNTSNLLHQVGNLTEPTHINEFICWNEKLEYFHLGLPKPDLVLFLDVPPEVSIENVKRRYGGKEGTDIHENIQHLTKVHERKDHVIRYCGWNKIYCCDENNKMLDIDEINCHLFGSILIELDK